MNLGEQIVPYKKELEDRIIGALTDFQNQTGICISRINIRMLHVGFNQTIPGSVEIEITL